MSRQQKTSSAILSGESDANIAFDDLVAVLNRFGFERRKKGNHPIFFKQGIEEIINLQPRGHQAKPYQVR